MTTPSDTTSRLSRYVARSLREEVGGHLLDVARARGVQRLTGHVLAENRRMLELLRAHGISAGQVEAGVVQFGIPVDHPPSVLSILGMLARRNYRPTTQQGP